VLQENIGKCMRIFQQGKREQYYFKVTFLREKLVYLQKRMIISDTKKQTTVSST
jgi:hypothetical protein